MFEYIYKKLNKGFGLHRWSKSRHIILIALYALGFDFQIVISLLPAVIAKYSQFIPKYKYSTYIPKIGCSLLIFSISIVFFSVAGSGISSAATVYAGTSSTSGTVNYQCDGTNDHIEINKALAYIDGQGGGTVYLRGPNTYWIDSTLNIGANTILTGDSSAEIKLVANAGWSSEVPMMANIGNDGDITVTGFTIDGNSQNQAVSLGSGYYNMMAFDGGDNIEVYDMRLEWGCGDGLQVRKAGNIEFTNNDVYKGHPGCRQRHGCCSHHGGA